MTSRSERLAERIVTALEDRTADYDMRRAGPASHEERVSIVAAALSSASPPAPAEGEREAALEEAAKRAEAEEEIDGPMPEAVRYVVERDPVGALRGAVRATKKGIAAGIRALKAASPRPPSSPPCHCTHEAGDSPCPLHGMEEPEPPPPGPKAPVIRNLTRPPSSPPTNRVTGETLPEWRERMHPRPFDGDAAIPSPDPGERTDVAWATQQRVHDLVYALDCIALHAAGEPTDPAEACRLIWKVAEAARHPPAPSPAAAPPGVADVAEVYGIPLTPPPYRNAADTAAAPPPGDGEGPSERYDRMAEEFHRATGMMAPGKDAPPYGGGGSLEERQAAWEKWLSTCALAAPPSPSPAPAPRGASPTPSDDVACYCGKRRLPYSERAEILSITDADGVEHRHRGCAPSPAETRETTKEEP